MLLKLISRRTLLSRTSSSSQSPYSIFTAQCSTSSPSLLTDSHAHSHPDSRNVSVSVWWDLENCTVPLGVNTFRVAQAITAAIKASGIKGPININAFGDIYNLSKTNEWAITKSGINLMPTPQGENYRVLSRELNYWILTNPPPAHVFLISDNTKFAEILCRLRNGKYNILLASKESSILSSYATIMWGWDALVRGENLTRRYFNQPPHGFWYARYEGLLEDPSTTTIERPVIRNMNWCDDSFWRDMQTIINTDIGSFIIAVSRTRENMAYYLQEYGPSVLKSVTKSDVLLMVDMLISEKKWVRETAYLIRPFKLTSSARITSANSDCTYSDSDSEKSDDDFSDSE